MILDPKYIARGWCGGRFDELVLPPGGLEGPRESMLRTRQAQAKPSAKAVWYVAILTDKPQYQLGAAAQGYTIRRQPTATLIIQQTTLHWNYRGPNEISSVSIRP